ncbi:MAG TPA: pirin family protein [Rhodocyclaceae bacterium]|nr:pirin family protein [Rhodocyclaceae bacterium]
MIIPRFSHERGHAKHGWLDSYHTFSFADYHDADNMGWGPLRVINEDRVAPGKGFGSHGHRDMEIISYVLDGALAHKDSMGNGTVIRPGDVQRMSAGQGVVHSEFNPSETEEVHFLQIWILPRERNVSPSYQDIHVDDISMRGRLCLIASPDGEQGSVRIHQDVRLYASVLDENDEVKAHYVNGRLGYLHVARGAVFLNGARYSAGDGAKIEGATELVLAGSTDSGEVLLFDLPR